MAIVDSQYRNTTNDSSSASATLDDETNRIKTKNRRKKNTYTTANKCNFNKSSTSTYVDFGKYTMNPTHLKWNAIACAISIAIRWHFSTYVYNSIDESFPCSLVLMCYSCQLSTTFASKMLFSISNALNKERKKTQSEQQQHNQTQRSKC